MKKSMKLLAGGFLVAAMGFMFSVDVQNIQSTPEVNLLSLKSSTAQGENKKCTYWWDYDNGGCPSGSKTCCQ